MGKLSIWQNPGHRILMENPTRGNTIVIKAAALFDPVHGFLSDPVLLVRDGEVMSVSSCLPADHATLPVVDVSPYSICAPFCDYHLHFRDVSPEAGHLMAGVLRSHGILSVYEGGNRSMGGFRMKQILTGAINVHVSGCALFRKGTYGGSLGIGVESVGEAKEVISRLHERGASYVKLINSGIVDPGSGEVSAGGFREPDLSDIILHASGKGLPVFCHANGDRAIRDSVNAGASAVIHGFFVAEDTLRLMEERAVILIPTVFALSSLSRLCKSHAARRRHGFLVQTHMKAVRKAWEMGVRLRVGTDAGAALIPYGRSYADELLLLARAGLPREEILRGSTVGALHDGSKATFVVIDGLSVRSLFIDGRETSQGEGANTRTEDAS